MTTSTLTSSDPQPGLGAIVRDIDGREWENTGGEEGSWANWQQTDVTQPDPETWVKVAGNYGPVTLVTPAVVDGESGTTSTLTVTEFVEARIEEDEDKVRGIKAPFWFQNGPLDPARVRAQCAAMWKIVEESVALDGEYAGIGLSAAVRALASIWSDHPAYDPSWE